MGDPKKGRGAEKKKESKCCVGVQLYILRNEVCSQLYLGRDRLS